MPVIKVIRQAARVQRECLGWETAAVDCRVDQEAGQAENAIQLLLACERVPVDSVVVACY